MKTLKKLPRRKTPLLTNQLLRNVCHNSFSKIFKSQNSTKNYQKENDALTKIRKQCDKAYVRKQKQRINRNRVLKMEEENHKQRVDKGKKLDETMIKIHRIRQKNNLKRDLQLYERSKLGMNYRTEQLIAETSKVIQYNYTMKKQRELKPKTIIKFQREATLVSVSSESNQKMNSKIRIQISENGDTSMLHSKTLSQQNKSLVKKSIANLHQILSKISRAQTNHQTHIKQLSERARRHNEHVRLINKKGIFKTATDTGDYVSRLISKEDTKKKVLMQTMYDAFQKTKYHYHKYSERHFAAQSKRRSLEDQHQRQKTMSLKLKMEGHQYRIKVGSEMKQKSYKSMINFNKVKQKTLKFHKQQMERSEMILSKHIQNRLKIKVFQEKRKLIRQALTKV